MDGYADKVIITLLRFHTAEFSEMRDIFEDSLWLVHNGKVNLVNGTHRI